MTSALERFAGRPSLILLAVSLFVPTLPSLQAQVLSHGPVVGGVTESSAQVFLRTSQAANLALRWSTDPNLTTYQVSATFATSVADDYTKIIPLTGLPAETTIYLNPVVNGAPQLAAPPYPSFKTFPAAGASRTFNFVVLSDFANAYTLTQDIPAFRNAAAELPVFAFIGGDFDHRNPNTAATKRTMFRDLYDPNTPFMGDFVNLILRRTPIIHQWDDHDAGANNVDRTYPNWYISQQVFQEYVPTYPLPAVSPGIWQKFSYAQVDGFVLDCRSQRDPEDDPDGADKSMLDGNNLGATGELQWLENGLLSSTAKWKVIFTSVVTNPTTKFPDGWAGYQTEWNQIRTFINGHNITGVVFISGDLHLDAIDDGSMAGFPEMCIAPPGGITPGFQCATAPPGNWSQGYYVGECAGYSVVSVQENPDRLVLQGVDENGVRKIVYNVTAGSPTPTPSGTPTPTPGIPAITTQPANATVAVGQTARFTVTATGNFPLRYQWRKNGADISGATKMTYITPATTSSDNGALFSVVVSNSLGSATSSNAVLTVTAVTPPSITTQPANKTVAVGKTAKFIVAATGTPPLSYQWRKNGANISGATASSYTTPPVTTDDNGALFSVVVSNSAGSVTSNNALLTVR